jgi:hypothetical protein
MYDPVTGKVLDITPTLLRVDPDGKTKCNCSIAAKARLYLKKDEPGYEDNICYHERLVAAGVKFDLRPPERSKHSYYSICGIADLNSTKLHVYCYSDQDSGREKESILTMTPGNVTCGVCHTGAKQAVGESKTCPHATLIWGVINTEEELVGDAYYIKYVYNIKKKEKVPTIKFDIASGLWKSDSLSAHIEDELFKRFNIPPHPVPKSIDDDEIKVYAEVGRSKVYSDTDNTIKLCAEIPEFFPPPMLKTVDVVIQMNRFTY